MATTPAPGEILCPDPSAHDHGQRISQDASKAALLAAAATAPERKSTSNDNNLLTDDGKLSSRGAASSLKYAKAQDLPSFPSHGGASSASLAAAVLAKDHKMKELWQPEASVAGSKAAVIAQRDGGQLDLWEPSASAAGNSAAVLAMRTKGLSPEIDRGYTDTGRTNSLSAAKMVNSSGRPRAGSVPAVVAPSYPDSGNSTKNALNAARTSTKMAPDGWDSEANQAARIKNLGGRMDPAMFGEHPPVEPELEEQRHNAALRASAVSMAKKMYDQQRAATPTETSSLSGAGVAHRRNQSSTSQADIKEEAIKYIHLQDAAHKIAQERLAKLDKEIAGDSPYRAYYGYGDTSPKKSRLSVRRRPRALSEGEGDPDDSDDERQARRIRSQMSQLSAGTSTVDVKQRQLDRAKLMAAAEKRVHDRMHTMDEKVFQETGKVSQSMMDEWEAKAREKAEAQKAERDLAAPPAGMVAIGGGKFMSQAEIEAIAAAKLKPTLEEINDTAEKMRARDAEIKRLEEERETAAMEEKMKQSQQKAEFKRIKEQDRLAAEQKRREQQNAAEAAKAEERRKEQAQKAEWKRIKEQDKAAARKEKEDRKAAERAQKEEAKNRRSEEQRKSRETKEEQVAVVAGGTALGEVAEKVKTDKEREEEKNREAAVAGSDALEQLATRVKEDKEREEAQAREAAEKEHRESSAAAAAGGATLAEIAEKVKQDREIQEQREAEEHEYGGIVAVGASGVAGVAGVSAYETIGRQDTGPAPNTIGPHESDLANILDPRVKPDPELQRGTVDNPETGPATMTIGPHQSNLANILDPQVQPDPAVQMSPVKDPETGPAPNTIGPHTSDLANIVDPRVKPDPELQKGESTTEGPYKSDIANIVDPRVDSQPKTEEDDHTARDTAVVATGGAAAATVAATDNKDQKRIAQEEPKRKSSSRGVFGRLTDKFKRRGEEEKSTSTSTPVTSTKEQDEPTEGAPVLAMPALGASLAAAGGAEEEQAANAPEKDVGPKDEDDQDVDRSRAAEALMGVGAVGAVGGAAVTGAAAAVHSGQDEEVARDEVSSLSTEDENDDAPLEQYTTSAEHSGHYNFATTTPPAEQKRPDLERHISAIEDSSESDSDAAFEDSDDEDVVEERGRTGPVVETTQAPAAAEEKQEPREEPNKDDWGAYERAGQGGAATEGELENRFHTYDLNDPNPEKTEAMKEQTRRVEQEKVEIYHQTPESPDQAGEKSGLLQRIMSPFKHDEEEGQTTKEATGTAPVEEPPRSPVSPIDPEDEITPANAAVSPEDPSPVVVPSPQEQERSAPAPTPAVASKPSEEESSTPQKERKGIKGIFSKLTSKPENKLSKRGQDSTAAAPSNASANESVKSEGGSSFVGGAKLTGGDEKDGIVSPVTTTSVGIAENEGRTDGTFADTQRLTGVIPSSSSAPRDESPSSFRRHEDDLADPDDASSSGAEEEEVKRGRAGRLVRKLGLTRDKGKEKVSGETEVRTSSAAEGNAGGEEQFEEARDHFDESLAPPPAFGGQGKSDNHSPARETRFQEEF